MKDFREDIPYPYNQCWECGYTPKCCSCIHYEYDGTKHPHGDHICLYKKKMKQFFYVLWLHYCDHWEWSFKEGMQYKII